MAITDFASAFKTKSAELVHRATTMVTHNHRLRGSEATLINDMAAHLGELEGELELLRSRDRENQAVRLARLVRKHIPANEMPYQVYAMIGEVLGEP